MGIEEEIESILRRTQGKRKYHTGWKLKNGGSFSQRRVICKYCLRLVVLSEYVKNSDAGIKHSIAYYNPKRWLHRGLRRISPMVGLKYSNRKEEGRFYKIECPMCLELLLIECREPNILGRPKRTDLRALNIKPPFHKASYLFPEYVPCFFGLEGEHYEEFEDVDGRLYSKLKDGRIFMDVE